MKNYDKYNEKVIRNAIKQKADEIKERIMLIMNDVANGIVDYIDGVGKDNLPYYTGNLQDSTGVGIYVDGALATYTPTRRAYEIQEYDGVTLLGYEELANALGLAADEFSKGMWIVLFSAVPYAFDVDMDNAKWYGYFSDGLAKGMVKDITQRIESEFKLKTNNQ